MNIQSEINAYYDTIIVGQIIDKYGFDPMKALDLYLQSETYRMFNDPELDMIEFAPLVIFDMWECEQITGNPRNSIYIRCD